MRRTETARVFLLCLCVISCRSREAATPQPQSAKPALQPVNMPDVSRNPAAVQRQLRDQYAILEQRRSNAATSAADLGDAYGRMGALFMAAEYFAEAEPALLDAEALAPMEMRWPYYLGHLYRMRGDTAKSAAAFERAMHANPSYAPTLLYLANAYLDQGKPDDADRLYAQALTQDPRMVAALFGRGRAALARRDYSTAIADFEQALAIDPQARVIHYPLAMAYRGAGQLDKAQAHLTPDNGGELKPSDPVLDDMNASLESAVAYELRGGRALDEGQWDTAAQLFRRGLELAPDEPALRHKLATALALKGDRRAALATFQETIRRSPSYAKSHYSLGLLYAEAGDPARAVQEFTTAIRYEPTYVEARLQLAELLRHTGKADAALSQYQRVVELDPRMAEAAYGEAMALVQLRRYRDARDRLNDALTRHPDHPAFAIALARLLAAAPDDEVRDGMRALQLLQGVPSDARRTFDWGVAMGMALAETGQYAQAAAIQQEAISLAAGDTAAVPALTETLHLYQRQRPCRRPWLDGEPMEMVDRPTA